MEIANGRVDLPLACKETVLERAFEKTGGDYMNLLLIGVLLAIIAIAYQVGLTKSRKLAGKGNNRQCCIHDRAIMVFSWLLVWDSHF